MVSVAKQSGPAWRQNLQTFSLRGRLRSEDEVRKQRAEKAKEARKKAIEVVIGPFLVWNGEFAMLSMFLQTFNDTLFLTTYTWSAVLR